MTEFKGVIKLKNESEEWCACGEVYIATESKQLCPHCGTMQLSCNACDNVNCDTCDENGNMFVEHINLPEKLDFSV